MPADHDGPDRPEWVLQLQQHKRGLSQAESKVSRYVLEHPDHAMTCSITELAEVAGVGEATISRLSRRLGFAGFHAFKIAIAQTLAPAVTTRNPLASSQNDLPSWIGESAGQTHSALEETLHIFDERQFAGAIAALRGARQVLFIGSGSSGHTAALAQQRFLLVGPPSSAHVDPHAQLMAAAVSGPEDVVVGVSQSGSTRDIHDALVVAKESGATVVCVTGTPRSPMTKLADFVLLAGGMSHTLVGNLFHQIPLIFLLEALVQGCARADPSHAEREDSAARAIARRIF